MLHLFTRIIVVLLMLAFIVGCKKKPDGPPPPPDPIVEKLATGQQLSDEEMKKYSKNKRQKHHYDKEVEKRKQQLAEEQAKASQAAEAQDKGQESEVQSAQRYREATQGEIASGKRMYPDRDSKVVEFDITPQTCQAFGFLAGTKVTTPKGEGYVVGVRADDGKGQLWFHITGDNGAAYWENFKKPEFDKEGFTKIADPVEPVSAAPAKAKDTVANAKEHVDDVVAEGPLKVKKLQAIPPIPNLVEE